MDKSEDCGTWRHAPGKRVQEARGLDAGPRVAKRLIGAGDIEFTKVAEIIEGEELWLLCGAAA